MNFALLCFKNKLQDFYSQECLSNNTIWKHMAINSYQYLFAKQKIEECCIKTGFTGTSIQLLQLHNFSNWLSGGSQNISSDNYLPPWASWHFPFFFLNLYNGKQSIVKRAAVTSCERRENSEWTSGRRQ